MSERFLDLPERLYKVEYDPYYDSYGVVFKPTGKWVFSSKNSSDAIKVSADKNSVWSIETQRDPLVGRTIGDSKVMAVNRTNPHLREGWWDILTNQAQVFTLRKDEAEKLLRA